MEVESWPSDHWENWETPVEEHPVYWEVYHDLANQRRKGLDCRNWSAKKRKSSWIENRKIL